MTPQQKRVSLETAKKLKEAGFPQETERSWVLNQEPTEWVITSTDCVFVGEKVFAAPDAQEIGELLPVGTTQHSLDGSVQGNYVAVYLPQGVIFHASNEAEARAACWLWLKEQQLI